MANSRQSATIFSPSSKRPTKRTRSSITEHSFQGITPSLKGKSVTHVSGTKCHLCLRPLKIQRTYTLKLLQASDGSFGSRMQQGAIPEACLQVGSTSKGGDFHLINRIAIFLLLSSLVAAARPGDEPKRPRILG